MLEGGAGAFPHLEVAPLAAEAPDDLAASSVQFVDGGGVAGGDEEVVVLVYVYGVDVEVVEGFPVLRLEVRFLGADVL